MIACRPDVCRGVPIRGNQVDSELVQDSNTEPGCEVRKNRARPPRAARGGVNSRRAIFRLATAGRGASAIDGILMPHTAIECGIQYRCKRGFIFITHRPLGVSIALYRPGQTADQTSVSVRLAPFAPHPTPSTQRCRPAGCTAARPRSISSPSRTSTFAATLFPSDGLRW